jgi:hypothetical protein
VPSNEFHGPPGTFTFEVTAGVDCAAPRDHYFVAQVFLIEADGTRRGPFFGPLTTTELQASAPQLQVRDQFGSTPTDGLQFNAFVGVDPPPQQLQVCTACGQQVDWNAVADGGWLEVVPPSGRTPSFFQCQPVEVRVHTAGLAPGSHTGQLTFAAFQAPNVVRVPVTLEVVQ